MFGVEQFMPLVLCNWNVLEAQGYRVAVNIFYQQNKSAILLEKNGKSLSSNWTKQINILYIYIYIYIYKIFLNRRPISQELYEISPIRIPLHVNWYLMFLQVVQ